MAETSSGGREDGWAKRLWYGALTFAIEAVSWTRLATASEWLESTRPGVEGILPHEGAHRIADPRYKEWWYFDAHDDSGIVISCSVVLSIVKDHYFLWVYDPKQRTVLVELEEDTTFDVQNYGGEGITLTSPRFSVSGRADRGYTISFDGKTMKGNFVLSEPIEGRSEVHVGPRKTQYSLYQLPKLNLTGSLEQKSSGAAIALSGLAYHDHWWGIADRYTRWKWMQAKFDNGWTASFYEGQYGKNGDDLHRYAWLHTNETGYVYFDASTFAFQEDQTNERWTATISGPEGTLSLTASKRIERYEFKPVVLGGLRLGEVQYHQYPVNVTGTFVRATGERVDLGSEHGMLEWDWYAIW